MTSSITVADARALLAQYVCPDDPSNQKFLVYLNQARERIINSGKWKGMTFGVTFSVANGYFTLPRDAEALLGIHVNRHIIGIQSPFYEYLLGGPNKLPEVSEGPVMNSTIDMGENFVTMIDIDTPGTIRFKTTSNDDAGMEVVIYGNNAGEAVYVDGNLGETLTLVSPSGSVTSTATFAQLTSVLKPVTKGNLEIYVVNGATETLLATYQPGETSPQYRRYRLKTDSATTTVTGLCKLKYFPLVSETEPLVPANIGALKMALLALTYEDANDPGASDGYWSRCYALLNQQLKENRGAARYVPNLRMTPAGSLNIPRTI